LPSSQAAELSDPTPDAARSLLIHANVPQFNALQIERRITLPLRRAVGGLSGVEKVRSVSERGAVRIVIVCESPSVARSLRERLAERRTAEELAPSGRLKFDVVVGRFEFLPAGLAE
ncbi:MAG TPA: hypothetical protein VGE52_06230, partial [Pirellulales bacterium]